MALRGNLKDFTLPDVFQLIAASKKTGVLRITGRGDAEGSVWFRDGDVFFAQSNWHHEKIGDRLVAAQKITPSALARALQIRAAEPAGRRIGQILVDEGYITQGVLEAFVQEQIQDTVFDLMRWDDGEFDFEILPEVVDEDIGLTVSIENIIMEGSRRLEEWARIKKKVPSMDIIFRMATAPGEGTYEISLKPVEWNLLLLIDGTRTVSELARATGRTDFEVARIVYGLFSAGLLEVTPEDEARRLLAEREERARRRAAAEAERVSDASHAAGSVESGATHIGEPLAAPDESSVQAESIEILSAEPAAEEPVAEPGAGSGADIGAGSGAPEPAAELDVSEPVAPVEVPEFLSGAPITPGPEDMAVFEEMVGALFEPPVPVEPEGVIGAVEPFELEEVAEPVDVEEPVELPGSVEVVEPLELPGPAEHEEPVELPAPAELEEPAVHEGLLQPYEFVEPEDFAPPIDLVESAKPEESEASAAVEESVWEQEEEPRAEEALVSTPAEGFPEELVETAEELPTVAAAQEPLAEEVSEAFVGGPDTQFVPETPVHEAVVDEYAAGLVEEVLVETEVSEPVFVEPAPPIEAYVEPAAEPREPFAALETPEGEPSEFEMPVPSLELEAVSWDQPTAEPMSVLEELGIVESADVLSAPEAGIEAAEEEEAEAVGSTGQPIPAADDEGAVSEVPVDSEATARLTEPLVAEQEQREPAWPIEVEAEDVVVRSEAAEAEGLIIETAVDAGFAGVISEEINALTGFQRSRPVTVVSNLEVGTRTLRRDVAIDRETLLKIIDGIQNL